jgi:cell fate regulator YaaT (PSP1 superfamily)
VDVNAALVEVHAFRTEPCEIPEGMKVQAGDTVVIKEEEGEDVGRVVALVDADEIRSVILRRATDADRERRRALDAETERVTELFSRLKEEHRLDMRVVGAHWRLDRKKVCFYFASESRLDFRALHKAVSAALNVRVAIKQVGVRDHARIMGGLGPCGRELCCKLFIRELRPIALRMARQQSLFVEPSKISGLCGKLLCCLGFEDQTYRQWLKEMPHIGDTVLTEHGPGVVTALDGLKRRVNVRYEDASEQIVALEELGCGGCRDDGERDRS